MRHTIVARLRNDPLALTRVVGLLRRRGFHVDTMTLGPSEAEGARRATLVVEAADVRQVVAQLRRLVDVLEAEALPGGEALERETALLSVAAGAAERPQIVALCSVFGGRVLEVGACSMVVEVTGSPSHLDRFLELVRPHGLLALARTGRIALARSPIAARIDDIAHTPAAPAPLHLAPVHALAG
ncbi:MAG TPA: acetolactate synthase small subunit [Longimicrobiales bacterium]|nr:acetolactate synthase small subunit [Longimicrobiales bacterium]